MRNKRVKRRKRVLSESNIDITSLLDILVILLVFLLSVYSSSDFEIKLVKDLSLPSSNSSLMGNQAIVVQVDAQGIIWFGEKKLGRADDWKHSDTFDALLNILTKKGESMPKRELASKNGQSQRTGKEINIVFDENLHYGVLHKLMHTSALAGFSEFKFIVKGLE